LEWKEIHDLSRIPGLHDNSINSATIFSKFPEMGERSKNQKIADFSELVMCPLCCLTKHA
jgi:hypothetical protein